MTNSSTADERIRVIAAVIERNGRYLLCQRPIQKRHGGLWEFPGGKVLPGETDLQAARRELSEELSLEVTSCGPALAELGDPGSPFLIAFVPVEAGGEPHLHEHVMLRWASADEMRELPLAPSDAEFLRYKLPRN